MKFAKFSIQHSLFVNLLSVFIAIVGITMIFTMRKEAFPPVAYNYVTVSTAFRGASAEKVERLVTVPLERELREVDNIEELLSASTEGFSSILIKAESDVKDMTKVVNDVQKAVDRVSDLPEDVDERPIVTEITIGQIPVIKISLSGNVDEFTLQKYTDGLKDLLEDIPGAASIERQGWRDEEYWVEPDLDKMKDYHLSFLELATNLKAQNVDLPGGKIKAFGKESNVKVKAELKTKADIENTIVRANDLGNWLFVKDIAKVKHTFEDETIMNKTLGSRSITLTVIKRENGDIIDLVDNVYKTIDYYQTKLPKEIKISTFYDLSYYVKRRLNVVKSNGVIALILVVLVLFIFLPTLPALMTAFGIPIAMFTTLAIMWSLGITINLITMFGLVIVLGIIVDDGIIISENIMRHIENGLSPRDAAIIGTDEVARPVITTVLTTIVAFSPLMLMSGILGKFVKYIPIVVILSLFASLLEAFYILPCHMADFTKPIKKGTSRKDSKWFKAIIAKYTFLLETAIKFRYVVMGIIVGILILIFILAKFFLPFVLFSSQGVEQFSIRFEMTKDTSLEKTSELIVPFETITETLPPKYLDTYTTLIGQHIEERGLDPGAKQGSNYGQITVYLTPSNGRDKDANEIMEDIRPQMDAVFETMKDKGVEKYFFQEFKDGPPVGKAIDIKIRGDELSSILTIVKELKDYLHSLDGVKDISDSYALGSNDINIIIDEEKAQKAYLSNSRIAYAIRSSFAGIIATTIKREKAEKEIKVLVRLPEKQRNSSTIFDTIVVENKFGNLIPLQKVASIQESRGMRTIQHVDGKRYISVQAEVDNKQITSMKANTLIKKKFADITEQYPGYTMKFSGENEETIKSMISLLIAFGLSLLMIYLILATLFNSLTQPFIIMLPIPLAFIGVIVAFIIHREPMGFLAYMGSIGLCGIVVNDAIVLVDFINKRRKELPLKEAIIEAGQLRLRPIIITTITTVAGLSTVAYGIGGLDPFLRPMALAIAWGLAFATVLTLIVIPCVYIIMEDLKNWVFKRGKCDI